MNYRGKKMRFEVEAPSGVSNQLFSVPAFNYGWQPHYLLDEPVTVYCRLDASCDGRFG